MIRCSILILLLLSLCCISNADYPLNVFLTGGIGQPWSGITGSPAVAAGSLMNNPVYTVYIFHRASGNSQQIYMINSSDPNLASASWSSDQLTGFETQEDSLSALIDSNGTLWLTWTTVAESPYQSQVVYATFDGLNWSPTLSSTNPGYNLTNIDDNNDAASFCLLPSNNGGSSVLSLLYPSTSTGNPIYDSNFTNGAGWNETTPLLMYTQNGPVSPQTKNQISCVTQGNSTIFALSNPLISPSTCASNPGFYVGEWGPTTSYYTAVPQSYAQTCLRPGVAIYPYHGSPVRFIFFPGGSPSTVDLFYNYATGPGAWTNSPVLVQWDGKGVTAISDGVATAILSNGNLAVFFTAYSDVLVSVYWVIFQSVA